jgi:hypothetical protein
MQYCCFNSQRMGTCYFEFQVGKFQNEFRLTSIYLSAKNFNKLNLYPLFAKLYLNSIMLE